LFHFQRRTAALFGMVLRRAGLSATAGLSSYSEMITYWHATSRNDKIAWKYRKTS